MSKRRILFLLELMLVICFSGCGSKKETGGENVTKGSDLSEFVKVDELHSTDAKFYKGKVVTGVDGYLTLLKKIFWYTEILSMKQALLSLMIIRKL